MPTGTCTSPLGSAALSTGVVRKAVAEKRLDNGDHIMLAPSRSLGLKSRSSKRMLQEVPLSFLASSSLGLSQGNEADRRC